MRVLDLCTQFASETKAFKDRGHEIVTLGIEGDVNIKCDVRQYFPSIDDKYDFIIAHPPCTEFSKANWRLGKYKDRKPDTSIFDACFRIINTLKPIYWMIENPQGAARHFIGKPTITIKYGDYGHYCMKQTDLWGEFPWFFSQTPDTYERGHHSHTAFRYNSNGIKTAAQRSLLPYGLSLAICLAIEGDLKL
jgi:hypothetical protein